MRLLDRYLLRELLVPLAYCLGGFLVFWISFDLFSELSEFQQRHLRIPDIAEYYLVKTPGLLAVVMPVALLLGVLYAVTTHARHNELTAMRAAGVSLWRSSLPYLAMGFIFSLFLFALTEWWSPESGEKAEEILDQHRPQNQRPDGGRWKYNVHFRNARRGQIWNIGAYNLDTSEMKEAHIEWKLPDGSSRHLMAKQGGRTNGCWTFFDVQQITYPFGSEFDYFRVRTNVVSVPDLLETPQQIQVQIKFHNLSSMEAAKRPQLSLSEIFYLRSHLQLNRRDQALLETQLHARLAYPWTCLVVVLIALPFGAASGRRNVFVGVASSILICFTFFILSRFGLALGTGNYIPAWLAAWFPNILFGGIGVYLTQQLP